MRALSIVLGTLLGAMLSTGCESLDCPDVSDTAVLETQFEVGAPCFADYERTSDLDFDHASAASADVSHNTGRNCQSCHQANGPGLGIFTAAGTIYDVSGDIAAPGTTVGLYEDRDRTVLVEELEVDQLGNVYTTRDLGLDTAKLFVTVWSADRTLRTDMGSAKFNLSCNFCHDASFKVELDPATDTVETSR